MAHPLNVHSDGYSLLDDSWTISSLLVTRYLLPGFRVTRHCLLNGFLLTGLLLTGFISYSSLFFVLATRHLRSPKFLQEGEVVVMFSKHMRQYWISYLQFSFHHLKCLKAARGF
jgi:hypothetical protein